MRLAALSDLHLGFRQFTRTTPDGMNQREADVQQTFRLVVDKLIALEPDLITIAGDIFHVVRPSNAALLAAHSEFSRLTAALPETQVIVAAGNHDLAKTYESAPILSLFKPLGIHVVERVATRITIKDLGVSVLCVPDAPGLVRPALAPDPDSPYNVLVLHGEVQGMLPAGLADRTAGEISAEELRAPEFDYVALGHYHVYREIQPNCFYSGSIDYTSSNPWGEIKEEDAAGLSGKGFVERDLITGAQTFHALAPSRRLVDLPSFSAHGMTTEDLDRAIRDAVDACPGGIDDLIVRLVVQDVPRELSRGLDQRALREYRRRALNFHLVVNRPEAVTRISAAGVPIQRRHQSLNDIVGSFLGEYVKRGESGFTLEELMKGAEHYLAATLPPGDDDLVLQERLQQSLATLPAPAELFPTLNKESAA